MSNIQSIERAFSILQTISEQPSGIRLTEIIPEVDLPRSTVARILDTLEDLGAVERHPERPGYRIGSSIRELAMQPAYLVALVRPYLERLATATDESVVLVLPDDETIYFADQIRSRHRLQVRDWIGRHQNELHADSAGKVFLAYWPSSKRNTYLARPFNQLTTHTITDPIELERQLAQICIHGYAWAYEELEEGVAGVSAPILDSHGEIVAAINITGPTFRLPAPNENQEMTALLVDSCEQISEIVRSK